MRTAAPMLGTAVFILSAAVHADSGSVSTKTVSAVGSAEVVQWVLALLLVLAVFGGCVWLLRKSGGLSLLNKGSLSILAGLSLGVREKLVLVQVGDKQLLLGVTPNRIDKLLELDGEQRLFQNEVTDSTDGFAQKLLHAMQRNRDA
jgi:flagellar protein FliO/FliZ